MSLTGLVFDIQRFSIHDGPGIRTTVFFKGCSLQCFWCHNPEGISPRPQIQYYPDKCIGCGGCYEVCSQKDKLSAENPLVYNREVCIVCGQCVSVCYAEARVLAGKEMTVDQVVEEVLRDRIFYTSSHGGVTLSGGDPLVQPDFAAAILERCKSEGLHTAIETAGNYAWRVAEKVLPYTDLVMMDIKHMDPEKHRQCTGVSNERILESAHRYTALDKPILFRIPVIPTVNDTPEEVHAIASFVRELVEERANLGIAAPIQLELLPFHRLAGNKYRSLGMDDRSGSLEVIPTARMAELNEVAAGSGIEVKSK